MDQTFKKRKTKKDKARRNKELNGKFTAKAVRKYEGQKQTPVHGEDPKKSDSKSESKSKSKK